MNVYLSTQPCSGELVYDFSSSGLGNLEASLGAGLGIPAGYSLSVFNQSDDASIYVTGFGLTANDSSVPVPKAGSAAARSTVTGPAAR